LILINYNMLFHLLI